MVSPELLSVGKDAHGRERFSTKTLHAMEAQMMTQAESLSQKAVHPVTERARAQALASRPLTTEQRRAFDALLSKKSLCTVVGYAGTGKSYLLGAAREAWERSGYQVVGATLSGIAAQGLEAGSGIKSRTLASRLYYWNKGEQPLTKKSILVLDEAGMLGSRHMARVVEEVMKAGAKLVQVGDFEQLQAIEAGAAFRGIAERFGFVALTEIRRQDLPWQKAATQDFAKGESAKGLAAYQAHHHVHAFETQAAAQEGLIQLWNDVRISEPHASIVFSEE
jgi:ATP-dependent exoDNAse (exonuclease V) alpha subunit